MEPLNLTPKTWTEAAETALQIFDEFSMPYDTAPLEQIIHDLKGTAKLLYERPTNKDAHLMFGNIHDAARGLMARHGIVYDREAMLSMLCRKQADYGPKNITVFGTQGVAIRIHDKIERYLHLTRKNATPQNESLTDTLYDIVGYSVVGIMNLRGQMTLPFSKPVQTFWVPSTLVGLAISDCPGDNWVLVAEVAQ